MFSIRGICYHLTNITSGDKIKVEDSYCENLPYPGRMAILPDHLVDLKELEHKMDDSTFYQIGNS